MERQESILAMCQDTISHITIIVIIIIIIVFLLLIYVYEIHFHSTLTRPQDFHQTNLKQFEWLCSSAIGMCCYDIDIKNNNDIRSCI